MALVNDSERARSEAHWPGYVREGDLLTGWGPVHRLQPLAIPTKKAVGTRGCEARSERQDAFRLLDGRRQLPHRWTSPGSCGSLR